MAASRGRRLAYGTARAMRVAWFAGQYLAAERLTRASRGAIDRSNKGQGTGWRPLLAAIEDLFARDLANIEAGLYAMPDDLALRPGPALRNAVRFFQDLPQVARRRREGAHAEVLDDEIRRIYPRYYLQNFHFQTDGWLSDRSAALYDHQVEVLFTGTGGAMRRQALPHLRTILAGRDLRAVRVADVACGTGGLIADMKATWPRLDVTAVDLSPAYLRKAQRRLEGRGRMHFVQAKAEALPFADASLDAITCVYLFHELPPKIREGVAAEFARVVKPGGGVVLVDALQAGDVPPFDGLLDFFPRAFHEPYFSTYAQADLGALFAAAGLRLAAAAPAFLSKAMRFTRD
ncbi:class I SAM-dependent methyltransferase [Oleomonas cavernae]|uniref:Class I SAM-dependent methyltransferase n=1 Tax=Oleomonas cavernae TaxID=2320859 RepID=A0A418WUD9_9PROT|nr:class I SAM-dependent methyltransferase [Oleomonas cavernae]RJF94880.1 class I SAM-dependent methyltransferase [Oleomonas cavernae]